MKSLRSNSRRKKKFLIPFIIAGLVVASGVGLYAMNASEKEPSNVQKPIDNSERDLETVEEAPSKLSDEDAAQKEKFINESSDDSTKQSTQESSVSMDVKQEGKEVVVQTKVKGVSEGQCTIKATANSKTYTNSVPVMYQPQYSSCAGFSIPVSELGKGKWSIDLTINNDESIKASEAIAVT